MNQDDFFVGAPAGIDVIKLAIQVQSVFFKQVQEIHPELIDFPGIAYGECSIVTVVRLKVLDLIGQGHELGVCHVLMVQATHDTVNDFVGIALKRQVIQTQIVTAPEALHLGDAIGHREDDRGWSSHG
jgi:hypothetical protein